MCGVASHTALQSKAAILPPGIFGGLPIAAKPDSFKGFGDPREGWQ
jgi:hypothetical protein